MRPTTILGLQSALVALQIGNAGLATVPHVPAVVPVMLAAFVGGLQFFLQHVGNKAEPRRSEGTDGDRHGQAD